MTTSSVSKFAAIGSHKKRTRDRKLIWRNSGWKLPSSGEGNRYTGLGSIESSDQDEPTELYTKTYYKGKT